MTVIEKINEINDVVKEIFDFTQENQTIKSDFDEYLLTIGAQNISATQMEKIFLPYIFERNINSKPILKMFQEEKGSKPITESFLNSQSAIFEIKKILKNGFELYNLLNEKTYTVLSLTKMTNFRGIYAGQFIVARIFKFENEHYIIEISNVLSHSQKEEAYRYAIMKLVHSPQLLYKDNAKKEQEIKNIITEMHQKFIQTFNKDIILTTNKYADEIIGAFNENENINITDKENQIQHYKFFNIKELGNNYNNFIENSMGGFSSHQELYDVAIIFDKQKGLYAIPFFETFCKIFEDKNLVENAKACVEYFLTNESIPNNILDRVAAKYPNFMETINNIMGTQYAYDDMMHKYKAEFLNHTTYSSATILFCSKIFSDMLDYMSEPQKNAVNIDEKVGRNDLCPCGSGKKYKKCCGK